jgi:hypothetical protein
MPMLYSYSLGYEVYETMVSVALHLVAEGTQVLSRKTHTLWGCHGLKTTGMMTDARQPCSSPPGPITEEEQLHQTRQDLSQVSTSAWSRFPIYRLSPGTFRINQSCLSSLYAPGYWPVILQLSWRKWSCYEETLAPLLWLSDYWDIDPKN